MSSDVSFFLHFVNGTYFDNSGRSAISPDGETIAVTNLYDGADCYLVQSQRHSMRIIDEIRTNVPIPVAFIDSGSFILLGGSTGTATIYDSRSGQPVQVLNHDCKLCCPRLL